MHEISLINTLVIAEIQEAIQNQWVFIKRTQKPNWRGPTNIGGTLSFNGALTAM